MRILWFTASPSQGAAFLNHKDIGCSWIESLETSLNQKPGIEIGVAFSWRGKKAQPYKIGKTSYYPISAVPINGRLRKFYSRWQHKISTEENLEKYLGVIKDFKPDIIHIFGTESDYGMLLPAVNIPCVVYIQGSLVMCNHKWYSGLTKQDVFKYSKKWQLLNGYGIFHSSFTSQKAADRERIIFKNSKFLIGRTVWDKRLSSVLSPDATYFHCDEIMRQKFYLNQWLPQENRNEFVIISVIRNNIFKGLETIYESKKILDQQFRQFNITWRVAGIDTKDEIVDLIEKKYKGSFSTAGVQLLGALQENELVNEMLNSDMFVHPSHIENSPNSLCEAMLLGMPAIATYAGGVSSILTDKKEGILVQDGDPYSMAGAIIELLKNKDYANSLGINARTTAIKRHDPVTIANQVMNIYSSILSK